MDLNDLLARHQTSLVQADRAACIASRRAHRARAAGYAARIGSLGHDAGAALRVGDPAGR